MNSNNLGENEVKVSELFVHHEAQDSHLCGTSVVELNRTLLEFGLFIKAIPTKVNRTVAEVTNELTRNNGAHDQFQKEDKGHNLGETTLGNRLQSTESVRNVGEFGSGVVNVSGKTDSGVGDQVSGNGKHADTAVLDLNLAEAVESGLGGIVQHAEGIIESSLQRYNNEAKDISWDV